MEHKFSYLVNTNDINANNYLFKYEPFYQKKSLEILQGRAFHDSVLFYLFLLRRMCRVFLTSVFALH